MTNHYAVWVSLLGLLLPIAGCSRAFYRHQADSEVYALIGRADQQTRSPLEDYSIQPGPQSRMFDPNCPDCPPMPPDDPTSHRLMHCVDCKRGWPFWGCYGHTPYVANPAWKDYLHRGEDGTVVLDRRAAMQLALLNSREYQNELEELYLSALDVTFERFRFDAQFYGGNSTFFTADGPGRNGSLGSRLQTDTGLHVQRLLATGGELIAGMANSLVWQFAGPDDYTATTLLDFSLVQPLLRAGGRAVALESLTDSERALLANIRQMERFRRGFYAQTITGRNAGPGPARGGIGLAAVAAMPGAAAGGIFRLLEDRLRIRNQRTDVAGLRDSLEQFEALNEVGRVDRLQVDQIRQRLCGSQSRLLTIQTSYQDQLDSYKISLGLPPSLELRIDDPLLEQFNLIDPKLTATQDTVAELLDRLRDRRPGAEARAVASCLAELASLQRDSAAQLELVRHDFEALVRAMPARRRRLGQLSTREEFRRGDVHPRVCDIKALDRRVAELKTELFIGTDQTKPLAERLNATLAEIEQLRQSTSGPNADGAASPKRLRDLLSRLSSELLELSLAQARARVDTVPALMSIELDPQEALQIARENRRDWMNARAALVDTWRQIEVAANDLRSGLDLTFSGDLSTTDNNPVRFRGTTGRLRVGLEFDAPLTRLIERNAYRQTLIEYQQARRAYYTFEDRVSQSLRGTLRAIRQNQLDFELRRAAVHVAISQVDLTRLRLQQPPKPGEDQKLGATTARDLVTALTGLLGAQNDFLGIWIDYEVERLNLDFDLGTMELDAEGNWIDPGPIEPETSNEPDGPKEIPPPEAVPLAFQGPTFRVRAEIT